MKQVKDTIVNTIAALIHITNNTNYKYQIHNIKSMKTVTSYTHLLHKKIPIDLRVKLVYI
jgi:hypothetical protein